MMTGSANANSSFGFTQFPHMLPTFFTQCSHTVGTVMTSSQHIASTVSTHTRHHVHTLSSYCSHIFTTIMDAGTLWLCSMLPVRKNKPGARIYFNAINVIQDLPHPGSVVNVPIAPMVGRIKLMGVPKPPRCASIFCRNPTRGHIL